MLDFWNYVTIFISNGISKFFITGTFSKIVAWIVHSRFKKQI